MRFAFLGAVAFCPHIAIADVSEADRAQIVGVAQAFSENIKAGDGIEFSINTMHMQFARNAATTFGVQTADEVFGFMRQGYEMSKRLIEVVHHDVLADHAMYGETGNWTWGVVPYEVQLRVRISRQLTPMTCNGLLVFGQDGLWFTHAISETADMILIATLPEFMDADLPTPTCTAGSS